MLARYVPELTLNTEFPDYCVISANKYIPLYAVPYLKGVDDKIFPAISFSSEEKRKRKERGIVPNRSRDIKYTLYHINTPKYLKIGNVELCIWFGTIFTNTGTPLLVYVIPKEKYHVDFDLHDNKDIVLLYASEMLTNPKYKTIHRKFTTEILNSCFTKSIEVKLLPSSTIESNTFATVSVLPTFKSMLGMQEYLKTVVPTRLFREGGDTFIETFNDSVLLASPPTSPPIPVETSTIELSIEEEALLYGNPAVYFEEREQAEREGIEEQEPLLENTPQSTSGVLWSYQFRGGPLVELLE